VTKRDRGVDAKEERLEVGSWHQSGYVSVGREKETIMEIYTYRIDLYDVPGQSDDLAGGAPDVTGWDVEAADGHIGKVDEATYEAGSSCLVVDTGFWIFGKKRMIPAGVVERLDADEKKVYVGMTKEQIKNAPDYDADRHRDDEKGYHREVGDYYGTTQDR
jgi:hypothetical protein